MSTATTRACEDAGCHDFGDLVIVECERRGTLLIGGRQTFQVAVAICRRCGAQVYRGWTPIETTFGEDE